MKQLPVGPALRIRLNMPSALDVIAHKSSLELQQRPGDPGGFLLIPCLKLGLADSPQDSQHQSCSHHLGTPRQETGRTSWPSRQRPSAGLPAVPPLSGAVCGGRGQVQHHSGQEVHWEEVPIPAQLSQCHFVKFFPELFVRVYY